MLEGCADALSRLAVEMTCTLQLVLGSSCIVQKCRLSVRLVDIALLDSHWSAAYSVMVTTR
jgi:hypothetical protein